MHAHGAVWWRARRRRYGGPTTVPSSRRAPRRKRGGTEQPLGGGCSPIRQGGVVPVTWPTWWGSSKAAALRWSSATTAGSCKTGEGRGR
jgi:hypothetical protein